MKWILFIFCCVASSLVCAGDFQLFEEDGKVGLKNEQGVVLLPPSFEALGWSDGTFSVIGEITGYKLQGHWGLINLKKEFVTKAEFESLIFSGADRVVAVKKISNIAVKTGSLTLSGTVTIPFVYDGISIQGLRAIVMNKMGAEYQFGVTDLNNKNIIPVKYSNIYTVSSIRFAVGNAQGKIALFSDVGKQTSDFFIDSISPFHRTYAIIYSGGRKGIIGRDGIVVAETQYREVKLNSDGTVQVLSSDNWKILDDHNQALKSLQADELIPFQEDGYCVVKAKKSGVIDKDLKEVWPIDYDGIGTVINNHVVVKKDGRWGLLLTDQTEVIPFVYDSLLWDGEFALGLTHELDKSKWSLINPGLKLKSKGYDFIRKLNDVFLASRNNFVGLVNAECKEIVHCVYDSIIAIDRNRVVVRFKGYFGIITRNEQWILAPQPFPVGLVNDSLYLQQEDKVTFLKKLNGDLIYFTENVIRVEPFNLLETMPSGELRRVDFNGSQIKSFTEGVSIRGLPSLEPPVNDGLRLFQRDGKFGFRDTRGILVIPNRYDSARSFSDKMTAFKLLGRWGYLDTEDKMIVHPTYDYAGNFEDGYAVVKRDGKMGLIDKSGAASLSVQYDLVKRMNGFLKLVLNNKIGLATTSGRLLIEPRYDFMQVLPNSQVIVGIHGLYGIITTDGLSVTPPIYQSITYDKAKNVYLGQLISEWTTLELPKNE